MMIPIHTVMMYCLVFLFFFMLVMVYFVGKKILTPDHSKKIIIEGRDLEDRKRKYRKRKGQGKQENGKLVHTRYASSSVKCKNQPVHSVIGFLGKTSKGAELYLLNDWYRK